jgi:peptidoglycan hydrolase-like protein with peptidoglycan-binding domain
VRQAQCEYNWSVLSPKIAEDGSFGPLTRAAIVRFQRCVGITADGIVGPVTWSRLNFWAASNSWAC